MLLKTAKILYGVVEESRGDNLELNRCRVRCFEIHDISKEVSGHKGIATEDLPLANSLNSTGLISGIGKSPTPFKQGTVVLCLSKDDLCQDIIILGSINGIFQSESDTSLGFNDPSGQYPLKDRLNEPDTNRLARGNNLDNTILNAKSARVLENVPIAGGGSWSEPKPSDYYGTKYSYNEVYEGESGNITEVDDTPSKERISTWHKSGAFDETINTGERIIKVPNNFYITVEDGHFNLHSAGNIHMSAESDILFKAGGAILFEAGSGLGMHTDGDLSLAAKGSASINGKTVSLNQ